MKTLLPFLLLILVTSQLSAQKRDLNFFLEQARKNSPLINKNRNDNKVLAIDLQQIQNILSKPEINFDASILFAPIISHDNNTNRFEWVSPGANSYNGYDQASTDGGQYQAMVTLTQPLFTHAKNRSYTDRLDLTRQKNENSIELTNHELEQLVNNQYIICLRSKEQSNISRELLGVLKNQLAIMQKLVENAVYRQTDLMLLQIAYQNYEVEYKTYMTDYESNLYDLNLICGIDDSVLVDIEEVNFTLQPDTSATSSFLKSYELDSLNIMAEQNIFELKYLPQLNFFANAGLNAVYQPAFNRLGFSTGLTFTWNIFDGNQRVLQRKKSAIHLQTITFDKQFFTKGRNQNKTKILNQINSLQQRSLLVEKQLDQYSTLYNAYQQELTQGNVSVMDLKNVLREMAVKKQEFLQLKMEKQALINLFNFWNY